MAASFTRLPIDHQKPSILPDREQIFGPLERRLLSQARVSWREKLPNSVIESLIIRGFVGESRIVQAAIGFATSSMNAASIPKYSLYRSMDRSIASAPDVMEIKSDKKGGVSV